MDSCLEKGFGGGGHGAARTLSKEHSHTTPLQETLSVEPPCVPCTLDAPAAKEATAGSASPTSSHGGPPNPDADADNEDDIWYPEGGRAAWLVVFGSWSGMFAAFGLLNTIGTLQAYLSRHQLRAESPAAIGWVLSIYVCLAFFGGVQIGPVFDKHGPRALVAAGTVLLLGGTVGLAFCEQYWHFILDFSIVLGVASSLIFTPSVSAPAHYFKRRRGYATGIMATGGSLGGVVFPLVLPELFKRVGYRDTILILAAIFCFFLIPANLFTRSRLPPKASSSSLPSPRVFKNVLFSVTTAAIFFIEWGLFIPLTYISSWAIETGVGNTTLAYQLIAVFNAASFFGRWLPGYVADRWGRFNTLILSTALCLAALLGLWLPGSLPAPLAGAARGSLPLALLFAAAVGFGSGAGISLTPVCIGELCEVQEYGRHYSACYTLVSLGCLTGLPLGGAVVSRCGGEYWGLVLFTSACYALALVSLLWVRVKLGGWSLKATV